MRKKKKANKLKLFLGLLFLLLMTGAGFFLINFESPDSDIQNSTEHRRQIVKRLHRDALARKENLPVRNLRVPKKLAVVIDDIGYDRQALDDLLHLKVPITFSILPHCRYSLESAERAHREGREILLHLPMEPHGYPERNPGRGALLTAMDDERLNRELTENIRAVPHITGVNNHMGSRFMEDGAKLKTVFKRLNQKKLFFLDSRTTESSKALAAAESVGIRLISRDVFIDNGADPEATYRELMLIVRQKGNWKGKVVIGHPYPGTIAALKRVISNLPAEGIEIVPVSRIP